MKSMLQVYLLGLSLAGVAAGGELRFREVVIDDAAAKKACYAVTLADVNHDDRLDIVVVTENRVQWYESPEWKKHVILEDQTQLDNVCIAPHDIDGDGKIDFALGAGWTKVGTIQWITPGEDPEALWNVHAIGVEPWTHRMRWADILGKGRPQLIVSPLNATTGDGVRLTAFEIPENPRGDRWIPTVIDDSLNRMHNHLQVEFSGPNPGQATLTASQEGLHVIRRLPAGFTRQKLTSGMPGDTPETSGSGEVRLGRFRDDHSFLATVEPMHGTHVAVYPGPETLKQGEQAERIVLDDSLQQGHAVYCVDLDGDGGDEVVAGHREPGTGKVKGPGVYVYQMIDGDRMNWKKHIVDDGGMACEDLLCEDLTGDGRPDIVAVGRKTLNVKLYVNESEQ